MFEHWKKQHRTICRGGNPPRLYYLEFHWVSQTGDLQCHPCGTAGGGFFSWQQINEDFGTLDGTLKKSAFSKLESVFVVKKRDGMMFKLDGEWNLIETTVSITQIGRLPLKDWKATVKKNDVSRLHTWLEYSTWIIVPGNRWNNPSTFYRKRLAPLHHCHPWKKGQPLPGMWSEKHPQDWGWQAKDMGVS